MANPRYMLSKFDSTCCDCGGHIAKDSPIRYLGRGRAECADCMPANAPQAITQKPTGNDWASALAWDDSKPEPGASIGAVQTNGGQSILQRPAPVADGGALTAQKFVDMRDGSIVTQVPISEIQHFEKLENVPFSKLEGFANAKRARLAIAEDKANAALRVAEQTQPSQQLRDEQHRPDFESNFTQSERAEGMTCELLVVLVNALDVAGFSGRTGVAAFCNQQAKNHDDSSRRGRLWSGLANAVCRAQ